MLSVNTAQLAWQSRVRVAVRMLLQRGVPCHHLSSSLQREGHPPQAGQVWQILPCCYLETVRHRS